MLALAGSTARRTLPRRSPVALVFSLAALAISVAALGVASAADSAPTALLLDHPVRVVATLEDTIGPHLRCRLDVSGPRATYALETDLMLAGGASWDSALVALRHTIGWCDGYLFVRTECGGGNAWKCASETVFALRGGRLVSLGTLAAWAGGGLATSRVRGGFRDYDADLEITDATSHAGAPGFEVRLRERGGTLVGERAATWRLLAKRRAGSARLAREHAGPPGADETWDGVVSPRLALAAIARWCGRAREEAAVLAEARGALPPDRWRAFTDALTRITPGALPRTSRGPDPANGAAR